MCELLRNAGRCVRCLAEPRGRFINIDHAVPKVAGRNHRLLLRDVVRDPQNLVPLCFGEHRVIDRGKISAYWQQGISGVVRFIGEEYPQSPDPLLLAVQRRQFAYIMDLIAKQVTRLNGDAPREFRDDYERAKDAALRFAEVFSTPLDSSISF